MGFGKVGINLAERTVSWVKTVGKTSVLQTKPTKPAKLNGLKYASELKTDTFVKKLNHGGAHRQQAMLDHIAKMEKLR